MSLLQYIEKSKHFFFFFTNPSWQLKKKFFRENTIECKIIEESNAAFCARYNMTFVCLKEVLSRDKMCFVVKLIFLLHFSSSIRCSRATRDISLLIFVFVYFLFLNFFWKRLWQNNSWTIDAHRHTYSNTCIFLF